MTVKSAARSRKTSANDESHPLASLMEVIGLLVEKYEDEHVPELEESCILREEPPKK